MIFEIKDNKILKSNSKLTKDSKNIIGIFKTLENVALDIKKNIENIHFCKIEDCKKYMYGTLCIPKKDNYPANIKIRFYLIQDNIIFIDEENNIQKYIDTIIKTKRKNSYNIMKFFHDLLEIIIKDDLMYLETIEKRLAKLEDKILENKINNMSRLIIKEKKEILRYYHYYNQLLDMSDILMENSHNLEIFKIFKERIDRLQNETLLLREYTHQLQDLYDSQIDLHQNNVMKILTVATTIFLPLTLITGWYGMNFKYMPEIYWIYGYPMVMILFLLVIIICFIIFKKKKFW